MHLGDANIFITYEGKPKYYDQLGVFAKPHNMKKKIRQSIPSPYK
jgi:hypothetical protein